MAATWDRTVHLRGAGDRDHVLDVVGVARASTCVRVVPLVSVYWYSTCAMLLGVPREALTRGVVDLVECLRLVQIGEFVVQDLGDSRGQGGARGQRDR